MNEHLKGFFRWLLTEVNEGRMTPDEGEAVRDYVNKLYNTVTGESSNTL